MCKIKCLKLLNDYKSDLETQRNSLVNKSGIMLIDMKIIEIIDLKFKMLNEITGYNK